MRTGQSDCSPDENIWFYLLEVTVRVRAAGGLADGDAADAAALLARARPPRCVVLSRQTGMKRSNA